MPAPWTEQEVEHAVADYFDMLIKEMRGEKYVKADHNRALVAKLNNRSKGAVEFKHENISAVLLEMEMPYIDGYKPRSNYQGLLRDAVFEQLRHIAPQLEAAVTTSEAEVSQPSQTDWHSAIVDPPELLPKPRSLPSTARKKQCKVDFAARESRNRKLGRLGEEFVLKYERYRLESSGKIDLANHIEWVSEKDDGAGFDILSFSGEGKEKFIEVKTTNYGRSFPFMISQNEVLFSQSNVDRYALYRLFTFRTKPRFFVLPGSVAGRCHLDPITYRAGFGKAG